MQDSDAKLPGELGADERTPGRLREGRRDSRLGRWSAAAMVLGATYVLSSGPVIAAGFWLREATH